MNDRDRLLQIARFERKGSPFASGSGWKSSSAGEGGLAKGGPPAARWSRSATTTSSSCLSASEIGAVGLTSIRLTVLGLFPCSRGLLWEKTRTPRLSETRMEYSTVFPRPSLACCPSTWRSQSMYDHDPKLHGRDAARCHKIRRSKEARAKAVPSLASLRSSGSLVCDLLRSIHERRITASSPGRQHQRRTHDLGGRVDAHSIGRRVAWARETLVRAADERRWRGR